MHTAGRPLEPPVMCFCQLLTVSEQPIIALVVITVIDLMWAAASAVMHEVTQQLVLLALRPSCHE